MPTTFAQLQAQFDAALAKTVAAQATHQGVDAHRATQRWRNDDALRQLFGGRPPLALVAFDTPAIQDYVFRVQRPIDVRGGSVLVEDFTRPGATAAHALETRLKRHGLDAAAIVYAGGGGGLVLVPAHKAEAVCDDIESALAGATGGDLASAAAFVTVWPADLSDRPLDTAPPPSLAAALGLRPAESAPSTRYAATRVVLLAALAERRSRQARLADTVAGGRQNDRCGACDQRVGTPYGTGPVATLLCDPCRKRRQAGAQARWRQGEAATFEDVVAGTDSSAMALLYADGANFGALFRDVASLAQHRALSDAVHESFAAAVRAARQVCRHAGFDADAAEDDLRLQAPICGGDDLALVMPATLAVPVIQVLFETIETALDRHVLLRDAFAQAPAETKAGLGRMGVGLGVAIADRRFGVRFLLRYAKELLRSAKGKIRASGARGAVDFLVLSAGNPLSGSVDELRARPPWRQPARGGEPVRVLTRRPYTRDDFESFARYARALRRVAPGQVHAVAEELARGVAVSCSLWRYQHARARPDDDAGWAAFRGAFGKKIDEVDGLLWEPGGNGSAEYTTRYLDALELRDYLPRGERTR